MVHHLRDTDVWDIYRDVDHNGTVLDVQETSKVLVIRNGNGTKVILRLDDETGAVEIIAEPNGSIDSVGHEPYHLMLGPDVPFSVLSKLIENA